MSKRWSLSICLAELEVVRVLSWSAAVRMARALSGMSTLVESEPSSSTM